VTTRPARPVGQLVAKACPRRQLHVVVDNYGTHKHAKVQAWLAKHPRIHLHLTPTYGSWLNLVEVFFSFRWVKDADQILGGLTGQPLRP
jgi:DDE superfamily endonuclease